MKRPGLVSPLLAATLFLAGALAARAQDKSTPPAKPAATPPPMMKANRAEELLKRFDLNHDGKLDDDEVAAAHEAML